MHVRTKFDGGRVINRSQFGSWEHRCMGAGLQHNIGKEWGPASMKQMTNSSPAKVFKRVSERSARKASKEKVRKAKDTIKQQRRLRKITQKKESRKGRNAYARHDNGILPRDVHNDVSPDHLEALKISFYNSKLQVTSGEISHIEELTRGQVDSDVWIAERRKRLTASVVGGIIKVRNNTKKAGKVEHLLYRKFKGNAATCYGQVLEDRAKEEYKIYQQQQHPGLAILDCGLFISKDTPWLAATPDGLVTDPSETEHSLGLVEIKNPYSARNLTLAEAAEKSSFCLKKKRQ